MAGQNVPIPLVQFLGSSSLYDDPIRFNGVLSQGKRELTYDRHITKTTEKVSLAKNFRPIVATSAKLNLDLEIAILLLNLISRCAFPPGQNSHNL
jgi:hypothetical protein